MGSTSSTPVRRQVRVTQSSPYNPSARVMADVVDDSTGPTSRHVGLENLSGENNCFLNSTIQALWHLNMFRERILYSEHTGGEENIDLIFSHEDNDPTLDTLGAVCSLFAQYQYTEEQCIPTTEIRYILSQLDESSRFAIGDIADAAETLDALLTYIHSNHVSKLSATSTPNTNPDDFCNTGSTKCISHLIFGGVFVSQSTCRSCHATNEPEVIRPYFHYASVMAILDASSERGMSFGHLLHHAFRDAAVQCPSLDGRPLCFRGRHNIDDAMPRLCSGRADKELSCLEPPMVLAVSLVWPSENVAADFIERFLTLLEPYLWLSEVFFKATNRHGGNNSSPSAPSADHQRSVSEMYKFRGFVCYYGKHYISIFQEWNSKDNTCEYLLFDDARVRRLGQWKNVTKECIRARYQPVLLLYEKNKGLETCSRK